MIDRQYIKLSQLCTITMGQSPSSDTYNTSKNGLPFYQGNADFGEVNPHNRMWCSSPKKIAHNNDLLVSVRAPIGAVNIATETCCIGRGLAALTPNEDCSSNYLFYAVKNLTGELEHLGTGSTFKAINKDVLENILVPYYAKFKQGKISQTLTQVDKLISNRKLQLALFDELIKSRFVEMFGTTLETVPLKYYINSLLAGKSLAGDSPCPNKVLKTGAVSFDKFDVSQVKYLPLTYNPDEKHKIHRGDVIISRMNTAELVGAAGYVDIEPKNIFLPDRLWKAGITPNCNPVFLWQMLISLPVKNSIRKIATGTSGSMKNISKKDFLAIPVIKVPFVLQNQFAAFVQQVDKSRLAVQKSLDELEILKKSLMQEYFG